MAKFYSGQTAVFCANYAVELHGGYGYCEEYPVARAWRDVRVMSIFAGTNEIIDGLDSAEATAFLGDMADAYRDEIELVLMNLVLNAIEAMPEGGLPVRAGMPFFGMNCSGVM